MKTCQTCGHLNEDVANFCAKCGGKLGAASPPIPSTAAPLAATAAAAEPRFVTLRANPKIVEENACAVCGQKFKEWEEVARCEKCGKYYHKLCMEQSGSCLSPECKTDDLKTCPFCAEKIKKSAVKCRFCGQILDQELKATLDAGQPKGDLKEAGEALTYSIIGLFCFGVILGPIAIAKGTKALNIIKNEPGYTGKGKATAGVVIGIIDIVGWLVAIMMRFSG